MSDEISSEDVDKIVSDAMEQDGRERDALTMLLSRQLHKANRLLAIRANMGENPSYVTSVTLRWVAERIGFAGDLPIFHGAVDPNTKKVPVDENTIDYIQQREPDWTRQLPMTAYLAVRKYHTFSPLLVVGYQDWAYEPDNERWGPDKRSMQESITATPIVETGEYFELDTSNTNFYALGGQHRLMAIMGLKELLDKGFLTAMNKDRSPRKNVAITREEVIETIHTQQNIDRESVHAGLAKLLDERIGIEIIPAVLIGEKWKDALFRLRGTFVDVNQTAKRLTQAESAKLDENNGFRIVARNIMVNNDYLKGKVEHNQQQLSAKSGNYTTLKAIIEIAEWYLGAMTEFSGWDNPLLGNKDLGMVRPGEDDIGKATRELDNYFSTLMSILPSHSRFTQGKGAESIREEGTEEEKGEDNILFRPIAQVALAEALAWLMHEQEVPLETLVKELANRESQDQLKLHNRAAPWFGVLCDPASGAMRRNIKNQKLCTKLFIFLLGGGIADDEDREKLRTEFAASRLIATEGGSDKAIDKDGEPKDTKDVSLPDPWR